MGVVRGEVFYQDRKKCCDSITLDLDLDWTLSSGSGLSDSGSIFSFYGLGWLVP